MNEKLLELKDICCSYGNRPVLTGVNLAIRPGETVLLAGPNGCGKSTMLKAIIGLLSPENGTIYFKGEAMTGSATEERVRSGIGYLRQTGNIFPGLTVRENLELSGIFLNSADFKREQNRVLNIFDFLGELMDKRSGELSGGQRQALAIAMVLLHPRPLYLLDEPTAGLSPKAAKEIMDRIQRVRKTSGQSILMVEHRLELLGWIDRAVILIQGKIQAETDDARVFLDPHWLEKHYF